MRFERGHCQFGSGALRIAANRSRDGMSSPSFQECVAFCDTRFRLQSDAGNFFANFTPAGRSELTKRVVLRGDALKIEQKMALAVARSSVTAAEILWVRNVE